MHVSIKSMKFAPSTISSAPFDPPRQQPLESRFEQCFEWKLRVLPIGSRTSSQQPLKSKFLKHRFVGSHYDDWPRYEPLVRPVRFCHHFSDFSNILARLLLVWSLLVTSPSTLMRWHPQMSPNTHDLSTATNRPGRVTLKTGFGNDGEMMGRSGRVVKLLVKAVFPGWSYIYIHT